MLLPTLDFNDTLNAACNPISAETLAK